MTKNPPRGWSTDVVWTVWLAATAVVAIGYMLSWMARHPLPEGWDEARFIIRMHRDARIFQEGGLVEGIKALLVHYRMREPGFRIAVLPLTAVVDAAPFALRAWSVLQGLVATGFLYATVRPVSGRAGAAIAAAVPLLSPAFRGVSVRVYTDPAIYLATGGSLYFLSRLALGRGRQTTNALGLALFMAFGALSKLTFGLVLGPVVLFALVAHWRGGVTKLDWRLLVAACVGAALLAGPHYVLNLPRWLGHVSSSASGLWALPGSGLAEKSVAWGQMIATQLFGVWTLLIIVALGIGRRAGGEASATRTPMTNDERAIVLGGLAGGIPLIAAHAAGDSGLVRLVTPVLFPLGACLGVMAGHAWRVSRQARKWLLSGALGATLAVGGIGLLATPVPPPHWDWEELRDLVRVRTAAVPAITYFGQGTELNPPQLEYPWALRDEVVQVTPIPTPDDLDAAWPEIEEVLAGSNVTVVVADSSWARGPLNQFNTAAAERLRRHPDYHAPEVIAFDSGDRVVEVLVFFRRD